MTSNIGITSPIQKAYNTVLLKPTTTSNDSKLPNPVTRSTDKSTYDPTTSSESRYASLLHRHVQDYSTELDTNKQLNEQLIDTESKRYDLHWKVKELQTELEITQKKYRLCHLTNDDLTKQLDDQLTAAKHRESDLKKVRKSLRNSQQKVVDLSDEILRLRQENKSLKRKLNTTELGESKQVHLNKKHSKKIEMLSQSVRHKTTTIDEYKQEIASQNVQIQRLRKDLQTLNDKTNFLQTVNSSSPAMKSKSESGKGSESKSKSNSILNNKRFHYFLLKWDTASSHLTSWSESVRKMIRMKTITLASISKESSKYIPLSNDILELTQILDDSTKFIDHLRAEKQDMITNHRLNITQHLVAQRKRRLLTEWKVQFQRRQQRRDLMDKLCTLQSNRQCQWALHQMANTVQSTKSANITATELQSKQDAFTKSKTLYFYIIAFLYQKCRESRRTNTKFTDHIVPKLTNFAMNKKLKYQILSAMKTATHQKRVFHKIITHRIQLNSRKQRASKMMSKATAWNKWRTFHQITSIHHGYSVQQHHQNRALKRKSITFATKMMRSIINARNDPHDIISCHFTAWKKNTDTNTQKSTAILRIANKLRFKLLSVSFHRLRRVADISNTLGHHHKIRQKLRLKFLKSLLKSNTKHGLQTMLRSWCHLSRRLKLQREQITRCIEHRQYMVLHGAFHKFRYHIQTRMSRVIQKQLTASRKTAASEYRTITALRQSFIAQNKKRHLFHLWFTNAHTQRIAHKLTKRCVQIYGLNLLRCGMTLWKEYDITLRLESARTVAQSTYAETVYEEKFQSVRSKAIAVMFKKTTEGNRSYWMAKWRKYTKDQQRGHKLLLKIVLRRQSGNQSRALKQWQHSIVHLSHLQVIQSQKAKANVTQNSVLRLMASQSQQRTVQIAMTFWKRRAKAQHSCRFIVNKYLETRYKANIQFAWSKWTTHTQHSRIIQLTKLHHKQQDLVRSQTLQSTLLVMAKKQKSVSIRIMFLKWKHTATHKHLQLSVLNKVITSSTRRQLQFAIKQWEKAVYSTKMVQQKQHIRKLRDYAKAQETKKKDFERKMKKKTIFLYLNMQSKHSSGRFFFRWLNFTEIQIRKKNLLRRSVEKQTFKMQRDYLKKWRHNADQRVRDQRLYRLKQQFAAHSNLNNHRHKMMRTFFTWKRHTIHHLRCQQQILRTVPISTKQLQRFTLQKWREWIKWTDINQQLEYQRRNSQKFESEITKLRLSMVCFQEDAHNMHLQQRYIAKWRQKAAVRRQRQFWITKCLESQSRALQKQIVQIWKRKICGFHDAKQQQIRDRKIKAIQLRFSNQFFQNKQRALLTSILLQWKLTLDTVRSTKKDKINSFLQKQYHNKLHDVMEQWRHEMVVQRKLEKIKKYFAASFVSASFKKWNQNVQRQQTRKYAVSRCLDISGDINARYALHRWYRILNDLVKKHFHRAMEQQKIEYYRKLKYVCKLQTIDSIDISAKVIITNTFKQWLFIHKASVQRNTAIFHYIEHRQHNLTAHALDQWHTICIKQQSQKRHVLTQNLFRWKMRCQSAKSKLQRTQFIQRRLKQTQMRTIFNLWMKSHDKQMTTRLVLDIAMQSSQRNAMNLWRSKLYHYKLQNETFRVSQMNINHFHDLCYFSLVKAVDTAQRTITRSALSIWRTKCDHQLFEDQRANILQKWCDKYQIKTYHVVLSKWRVSTISRLSEIAKYQSTTLYDRYLQKQRGLIFKFWHQKHQKNFKFRQHITCYFLRYRLHQTQRALSQWKDTISKHKVNDKLVRITQHYDNVIIQIKDKHDRLCTISQSLHEQQINTLQSTIFLLKWRNQTICVQLSGSKAQIKSLEAKHKQWRLQKLLTLNEDRTLLRSLYQWKHHQILNGAQQSHLRLILSTQETKKQISALHHFQSNVLHSHCSALQQQNSKLQSENDAFALAMNDLETMRNTLKKRDSKLKAVQHKVKEYKVQCKQQYLESILKHITSHKTHKLWTHWRSTYDSKQRRKAKLNQIMESQHIKMSLFVLYRFKANVLHRQIGKLEQSIEQINSDKSIFIEREQELQYSIGALRGQIHSLSDTINALTDENAKLMQYRLLKTKSRQKSIMEETTKVIQQISPQNIITDYGNTSNSNTDEITAAILLNHKMDTMDRNPGGNQRNSRIRNKNNNDTVHTVHKLNGNNTGNNNNKSKVTKINVITGPNLEEQAQESSEHTDTNWDDNLSTIDMLENMENLETKQTETNELSVDLSALASVTEWPSIQDIFT